MDLLVAKGPAWGRVQPPSHTANPKVPTIPTVPTVHEVNARFAWNPNTEPWTTRPTIGLGDDI